MDGVQQASTGSHGEWDQISVALSEGTHSLGVRIIRSGGGTANARIDDITVTNTTPPDYTAVNALFEGWVGIGGTTSPDGILEIAPPAQSRSVETPFLIVDGAENLLTLTDNITDQRWLSIPAPTISISSAKTVTRGTSLYIGGAPSNSGAGTLSAAYSIFSDNGLVRFDRESIGATPTDGIQLLNNTAAADGAQQYGPALHQGGYGWKTDATAASQAVDWMLYPTAVQAAANPTSVYNWDFSVNGGAYATKLSLSSAGLLTLTQVKITGGTPGIDKILTDSDGTGLAVWKTLGELGTAVDKVGTPVDEQVAIWTDANTIEGKTLTQTANQVLIVQDATTVTFSTPQSIHTAATPQFAKLGLGLAAGSEALDILGRIKFGMSRADATQKDAYLLVPHYTNVEEELLAFYGTSSATGNTLVFGGGGSAFNAATVILFKTAANTTTLNGTERLRIDSTGLLKFSAYSTGILHSDADGDITSSATNLASADVTGLLPLANGGLNANLTASNGGIFYSTATAGAILAGTATANKILLSGSSAAPAWSTATYPTTTTINQILYSSAANTVVGLASTASSILVTDGSSVPSLATDIPTAITIGGAYIYRASGTDVSLADGGTNASLTAVAGAVAYSGASAIVFNAAGNSGEFLRSGGTGSPTWFDLFTTANTFTAAQTINNGTTPADNLILTIAAIGVAGTRDSHSIRFTGASDDGFAHIVDWKLFNDVTSNAGASTFTFQSRVDVASLTTRFSCTDAGIFNLMSGGVYQVNGIAIKDLAETFQNKTLDNTNTVNLKDTLFTLEDDGDSTKKLQFQLSGITTGNTRTLTVPNASDVIAVLGLIQTFQNKTLDNSNTFNAKDTLFTLEDDGDATKKLQFQCSGITGGQTRTLTAPDASGTLALLGLAQTFSAAQTFSSDVSFGGNILFTGTAKAFEIKTSSVLVEDNHIYLNSGYTADTAQTGGFVINYDPTTTTDTVAATGFVAGVASTSNPTVITTGSATFSAHDLIQISGAENPNNNGLFEVLTHTVTTLTIKGIGTTATTQDWVQNQFVTDTTVAGSIYKVNVSVLRCGSDGVWEVVKGSSTSGMSFVDLVDLSSSQTLSSKVLTAPDINAGTADSLTSLSIRDTSAAFDVTFAATSSSALTAGRTVTWDVINAARSIKLAGDIDIAHNFITSGAYALTLTTTGTTGVTLPTTGTLATLIGIESLQNKTLDNTNTLELKDTLFTLQDDGDANKKAKFQCFSITSGQTRTYTLPDASDDIVVRTLAQTIATKTFDNTNTYNVKDTLFTLQDDGDATKLAAFQCSTIGTGVTRTFTFPNASGIFALSQAAETFISLNLSANSNQIVFDSDGAASGTLTWSPTTSGKTLTLPDITDTVVTKTSSDTLTNKVLSDATCKFGDDGDITKALVFSLGGATTAKTLTLISSHTDNRSITYPDATDTLVGKATSDTLTNKSFDCDGTGNALTNVNGNELDPSAATTGAYGIPIIVPIVNSGSTDINVFGGNVPFKFRIIDVWAVNTKAGNAGNWKLTDGTNDITGAVTYGASDKALTRTAEIDDAQHDMTGEALHLINSDGTDTAIVYVSVLRVD